MSRDKVAWQVDDCPSWCVGGHRDDDRPADRVHTSAGESVEGRRLVGTVVEREGPRDDVRQAEVTVVLRRRDGAAETWVYVGDGFDQYLELDLPTWSRLLLLLSRALSAGTGRTS